MKKPPAKVIVPEAPHAARLVEAVTLLVSEHAAEHGLSTLAVLGSLSWIVGRMIGAMARDAHADLEFALDFLVRHVRQAAEGEFGRRSYAIH